MSFQVYEETLTAVQDEAAATLRANRNAPICQARLDWLYRSNPDGEAVLWSVRHAATHEMAGFTVALPRRVAVNGRIVRCWNCADFSIHQKFRTLGVAIKLRRAAKEEVDAGRVPFLYAHPNARMQVIHERVGHKRVGTMVRFAKLLRSRPAFERRVQRRWLAGIAAAVADPVLQLRGREWRHRSGTATRVVSPLQFDDRFDALFEQARSMHRVVGVRDARYLTWRYAENPLYQTHGIVAEARDRLLGYALFTIDQNVAHVKDLFSIDLRGVARDLVAALVRHCRTLRMESISVGTLDSHPMLPILAQFGFVRRPETSEMFAYAPEGSALRDVVLDGRNWCLTVGDRDV